MGHTRNHLGILGILQVVSFLVLWSENHLKCILCTLHTSHDIISTKTMIPDVRAYPQLDCVKI